MNLQLKPRLIAAAIHLGISFIIFLVLAAVIRFIWYPGFLFEVDGGWEGIKLIAGVDLVIGPFLTLLVYNTAKPELKRDLSIIAALQLACIIGGMWVVHYSRPLAVVFTGSAYYSVNQESFLSIGEYAKDIEILSGRKPHWLALNLPEDDTERAELILEKGVFGGTIQLMYVLYVPYQDALPLDKDQYLLKTRFGSWQATVNPESGEILSWVHLY